MSERERHIKTYIKTLERMFYSMEKLENGVILPTSEVKTALAYAISSLKTDLKYDLMYEDEDIYTKADMVDMLTELEKEIEGQCKIPNNNASAYDWNNGVYACYKVIQQKINSLKESIDGK